VSVRIDGGMLARIVPGLPGAAPAGVTSSGRWTGKLAAGGYSIETASAVPDNRVDYDLTVSLKELIPGQNAQVNAPAIIPVSLGGGQQYEIWSFGDQDVRAALFDASGRLVAENDDRDNDWNFLLAGNFAPGAYSLHVDPVGADNAQTQVFITSPAIVAGPALKLGSASVISDGQVHDMDVPAPPQGSLMLLGATAAVPVGLALTTRQGSGPWKMLATTTGLNPYLAVPAGMENYRLRVWAEDHGATPVAVSVQFVSGPASDIAALSAGLELTPVSLGARQLGVSRIAIPQPQVLQLGAGNDGLQWSAATDTQAAHDLSGAMLATGSSLWLVDARPHRVSAQAADMLHGAVRLNLAAGHNLTLPLPGQDEAALWQVLGQGGQPGIAVTGGGSSAPILALGGSLGALSRAFGFQPAGMAAPMLHLWQAGSPVDPLPLTVRQTSFPAAQPLPLAIGGNDGTIPPRAALSGALMPGWKRLSLDMPSGVVAVLSRDGQTESLIAGDGVTPDVLESDADRLMLLNPGAAPAPYSVSVQQLDRPGLVLTPGELLTSYNPAPAILHIPILSGTAMPVRLAGSAGAVTIIGHDGAVASGDGTPAGAGSTAVVTVGAGLAVISEDGNPGNDGVATQTVSAPGSIKLSGAHMRLALAPGDARLVHLQTDVPVILRGQTGLRPLLFTSGAALNLFQPKGQPLVIDLQSVTGAGLSGVARFEAVAPSPIADGLGPAVRVAPGEARLFSFSLDAPRSIGVGVRGSVDDADCRLLAADGTELGHGVVAMAQLPPGTYFLIAGVPVDGVATDIQPALVGKTLPDDGPPPDVQASYRELAVQP
jgi:hypothetical protein